ncbi:hypothetical protein P9112_002333 [Eukaryota sp. TZLM1-RC]
MIALILCEDHAVARFFTTSINSALLNGSYVTSTGAKVTVSVLGHDLNPTSPNTTRTARSTLRAASERSLSRGHFTIVDKLIGSRSLRYELFHSATTLSTRAGILYVKTPDHPPSSLDPIEPPSTAGKWEHPVFNLNYDPSSISDPLSLPQVTHLIDFLLGNRSAPPLEQQKETTNIKTTSLFSLIDASVSNILSYIPFLPGDSIAEKGVTIRCGIEKVIGPAFIHSLSTQFKRELTVIPHDTDAIEKEHCRFLEFIADKCE